MKKRAYNALMKQAQQNYSGGYATQRPRVTDHDTYDAAEIFLNPRHANPLAGQNGLQSKILAGWSALRGGPNGATSNSSLLGRLGRILSIEPNKKIGT